MKKTENGFGETSINIRASINKVSVDVDKDLVIFFARKRNARTQDAEQSTLDEFME